MKNQKSMTIACAVAAALAGSSLIAAEVPVDPARELAAPPVPVKPQQHSRPVAHAVPAQPSVELTTTAAISNAGFGTKSAFAPSLVPSPDSTTLSPPVTITYSGGSPVLLINDNGTNKGVESVINNKNNSTSALYGLTNGSGAGLTGFNSGTGGPAGKFGITNSDSSQAAVTTTTNGNGSALVATITKASSEATAILGQNTVTSGYGVGVEGEGNAYGVEGYGYYAGVYGNGTEYGVWGYSSGDTGVYGESSTGIGLYGYSNSSYGTYGYSSSGTGVYGGSSSGYGLYAYSYSGTGLYANNGTSGHGITAHSAGGIGVYSSSDTGYGIWGQSKNSFGVIGEDSGSGFGVYGYSATGFAAWFDGKVEANSYTTLSDRNAKTLIKPVDGRSILERVDQLPVASWVFKDDPKRNHVGPMAQDFHAAFGLDGDDDKHINLTDIAGVSLAAIKELSSEMKEKDAQMRIKDAQIAALEEQLKSMGDAFSARMTALEQQQQRFGATTQTVSLRKESGPLGE